MIGKTEVNRLLFFDNSVTEGPDAGALIKAYFLGSNAEEEKRTLIESYGSCFELFSDEIAMIANDVLIEAGVIDSDGNKIK